MQYIQLYAYVVYMWWLVSIVPSMRYLCRVASACVKKWVNKAQVVLRRPSSVYNIRHADGA